MNTETDTMSAPVQHRVMRTYEIALRREGEPAPVAATNVNLSYELDDDLNAINRDGTVVGPESITAKVELVKRLRKLINKGAVPDMTTDLLDECDWDTKLIHWRFVDVACDATGRPIPRMETR